MEYKAMGIMVEVLVLPGRFLVIALVVSKINASLQNRYYPLINTILRWWVMSYPWTSKKVSSPPRNASHVVDAGF